MTTPWLAALLLIPMVLSCGPSEAEGPSRPNIVMIIVDDLGWTDTGAYGSTFYQTPHIDQFADEGMRFTDFYTAASICSPTRASLMTGQHPARLQITNWIGGEQVGALLPSEYLRQLPLAEVTIGEALQDAGYATGYIGKWHLGGPPFMPEDQGFSQTVAVNHAGQPGSYFYPYKSRNWPNTDVPDLEEGDEGEYLTDRLTDEALRFIQTNQDTTFFLVLSHYSVHTPLQAPAELVADYAERTPAVDTVNGFRPEGKGRAFTKLNQNHPTYAAMVETTDNSIGRVMAELEQLGLDNETVVLFVSDNGGLSTLPRRSPNTPTSNLPLRAGKGWLYEGGIRAPFIVRWPGKIPAGATASTVSTSSDLFPTMLGLAGLPLQPDNHEDGESLFQVMTQGGSLEREAIYWHFPHYHGSGSNPSGAIREGNLKLIEWYEDGRIELFDLAADPGETRDLAEERSGDAQRLQQRLADWRVKVGAVMPLPNPEWVNYSPP